MKPNPERKEREMKETKVNVIEVIEVKKNFIREEINGMRFGYNPDLFNEELIEVLRDCFRKEE